jgi:dienelactone hydrolase
VPRAATRRGLLGTALLAAAPARAAELRTTWRDPARGRDLPVLIRLPDAPGPRPVMLLSHGLGGSREGLVYLGEGLARAGFVAIHLQHAGSDDAVGRDFGEEALRRAGSDSGVALARLLDGAFATGEAIRRGGVAGDPLAGRVDAARIGVAGHSYGAWAVQHLLGQGITMPRWNVPDRRLRAGIALSPVPPRRGIAVPVPRMTAPLLHMTGTADSSPLDEVTWEQRTLPYRLTVGAPAVLVVLRGARHGSFAGQPGARWSDTTWHARILGLSLLFLRAMVLDEAAARAELASGAPALLGPGDTLEAKGLQAGAADQFPTRT